MKFTKLNTTRNFITLQFRYKLCIVAIKKGNCEKGVRNYTEAGKAIGFALEQPLHVVALPCSAWRILKRL
ncbi:MAG: hypothetical protein LBK06_02835 [Planctomycetaceae bacterium]|nr:hypothetical protein [Planctomycetaceae bacterium]